MRRRYTFALLIVLLLSSLWTAWQWMKPYDPTNMLPWKVEEVTVRRDHNFGWVEIVLINQTTKTIAAVPLTQLFNQQGVRKEPADARISSDGSTCQIRYWIEWPELESAWQLKLDDGTLRIKDTGAIALASDQSRTFRQPHW